MPDALLTVENLSTAFGVSSGRLFGPKLKLVAVNNVSFTLNEGETLGIVGESGCGKSTLGRTILRLIEPSAGRVVWQGRNLPELSDEEMRRVRQHMQIIFQDPIASLDPRMTVGDIIGEPLTVFEPGLTKAQRLDRVREIMSSVGLARDMVNRYPHEFSGGQAQRIGIARAIVTKPKLVICDEPVSALDVSIQAQIINLLDKLRADFGLTLIFISHDLSVVRLISDRILVLYLGRVVESGPCDAVFTNPQHPYTKALLSAAPIPDPKVARQRKRVILKGDPPSPMNPPKGCVFSSRCPYTIAACSDGVPPDVNVGLGHVAACIRIGDFA